MIGIEDAGIIRAACTNCHAHGCPACDGTGWRVVDWTPAPDWHNTTGSGRVFSLLQEETA